MRRLRSKAPGSCSRKHKETEIPPRFQGIFSLVHDRAHRSRAGGDLRLRRPPRVSREGCATLQSSSRHLDARSSPSDLIGDVQCDLSSNPLDAESSPTHALADALRSPRASSARRLRPRSATTPRTVARNSACGYSSLRLPRLISQRSSLR